MADLTYTNDATARKAGSGLVVGKGEAGNLKVLLLATIELAAATQNDTINFGNIMSNARISSLSRVYWDDLDNGGSPTLDMGLGSVEANISNDPVAFSNGHVVTSADVEGVPLVGDIANHGLSAWDFVSGQATDPGGELVVYGSIVDAATDQTGTVTVEVLGYLD